MQPLFIVRVLLDKDYYAYSKEDVVAIIGRLPLGTCYEVRDFKTKTLVDEFIPY